MEQQEVIDKEFLERLQRTYSVELINLHARILAVRTPRFDPMTGEPTEPREVFQRAAPATENEKTAEPDDQRAAWRRRVGDWFPDWFGKWYGVLGVITGFLGFLGYLVILSPGLLLYIYLFVVTTISAAVVIIAISHRIKMARESQQKTHIRSIEGSTPSIYVGPHDMQALQNKINDLETALGEIRAELARLPPTQPVRSTQVQLAVVTSEPEECDHWRQLLHTHTQVIRILELDKAKLGNEFHYSKRIELDERRIRAGELRQQITASCPG
jgi:hypothetical protein